MIRRAQTVADLLVMVTLVNSTGGNATGESNNITCRVWHPNGNEVMNFTAPTVSEVGTTGCYLLKFTQASATKAFATENSGNPYMLIVDSSTAGIDPAALEIWVGTAPAKTGDAMTLSGDLTSTMKSSVTTAAAAARALGQYPASATHNANGDFATVTWSGGKVWTYNYNAQNQLTSITEA